VTLTAQNIAKHTAALCGLISDPIQLKQIVSQYKYRCFYR